MTIEELRRGGICGPVAQPQALAPVQRVVNLPPELCPTNVAVAPTFDGAQLNMGAMVGRACGKLKIGVDNRSSTSVATDLVLWGCNEGAGSREMFGTLFAGDALWTTDNPTAFSVGRYYPGAGSAFTPQVSAINCLIQGGQGFISNSVLVKVTSADDSLIDVQRENVIRAFETSLGNDLSYCETERAPAPCDLCPTGNGHSAYFTTGPFAVGLGAGLKYRIEAGVRIDMEICIDQLVQNMLLSPCTTSLATF